MITPRLTDCVECTTISTLLSDIDCKLTEVAKLYYGNITLMLNNKIDNNTMWDLINYKRILTYRYFNSDYNSDYTLESIASRIKILKYK